MVAGHRVLAFDEDLRLEVLAGRTLGGRAEVEAMIIVGGRSAASRTLPRDAISGPSAVGPVALLAMATLFAGPEASLEIGDGPAAPDGAYCTMRLRVDGHGIQCDIDSYWFRDDLLALAALLRTLREDPDALEGREVDGQRGPGLRVLRAHPEDSVSRRSVGDRLDGRPGGRCDVLAVLRRGWRTDARARGGRGDREFARELSAVQDDASVD